MDGFRQQKANELKIQEENLVIEFKERKRVLLERASRWKTDYDFLSAVAVYNSGKHQSEIIESIENYIQSEEKSMSLQDWRIELTMNQLIGIMCEITNYFLSTIKSKYKIDDLIPFCTRILINSKHITIRDFAKVFRNGINGRYGSDYHKLDEATYYEWLNKYLEKQSIDRECEVINSKPEESNVPILKDKKVVNTFPETSSGEKFFEPKNK